MPRTVRFHLEENADPRIAAGLRMHGVDVSTTQEAGLLSADDLEQPAYLVRENRPMVTLDPDFLRLHTSGHAHPGIVFYASGSRSIGQVISGLRLIWEWLEPDELADRIEFL